MNFALHSASHHVESPIRPPHTLCKSLLISALTLCVSAGVTLPLHAQSPEVKQAQTLIWGQSAEADPAAGRNLLEKAAQAGDLDASRLLGEHLIYGWVLDKDVGKGLALLSAAANAGDALAKTKLGEVLLTGAAGRYEPQNARALLEAASAQNDPEAMRLMGEQLIFGTHFEQDIPVGLEHMERAVALGHSKAMVSLGTMYLDANGLGRNREKALELFEAAAELGDGNGLAIYGADMMWREIDAEAAEAMLLRAGELGSAKAYASLAQGAMYGYLGGGAVSRSKYAGYAGKAESAEAGELAILEAERKLWGIGSRANGPEAVAILTQAADDGNKQAAKYLITLLRDGNNLNVRRSPSKAQAALSLYSPLLTAREQAQLALTLMAAKARTPSAYAEVYLAFEAQTGLHTEAFGRDVYKANPNVAVYILQAQLKAEGLYQGGLDGYATRRTLAAIYDACSTSLKIELCNDSVMRPDVIGALLVRK